MKGNVSTVVIESGRRNLRVEAEETEADNRAEIASA